MARIFVYAELSDGKPAAISMELLAKARELGDAEVIVLGPGAQAAAGELGRHGAKVAHVKEDPSFAEYLTEPAADIVTALVRDQQPDLVLFGFTPDSRDVAGRVAARLGIGLISNSVDVVARDGGFVASVPYFGGAKIADYKANQKPAIVLLRPKSVEASETGGEARIEEIAAPIGEGSKRARVVDRRVEAGDKVKLEDAQVIVSGGRGLQGPENFELIEGLADALGAAVGASRAVVDAGWVPYSMQVGQTGKTVRPSVYLAFGISGAMQHMVGMKNSKVIIAINKDPEAPIMKVADLGVVGDAMKILPALTDAVKARKGR